MRTQSSVTCSLHFEHGCVNTATGHQLFVISLFAFQSQGISGGPWIGPTVEDTLKAIKDEGHAGVVMQPIGFLCDHVEILYDIDIAFKEIAHELGLQLWRAESLNDSPILTQALAEIVTGKYKATSDEITTPSSA